MIINTELDHRQRSRADDPKTINFTRINIDNMRHTTLIIRLPKALVPTIPLNSNSLRFTRPLKRIRQQSLLNRPILSSIIIRDNKRDITIIVILRLISIFDNKNAVRSDNLKADVRMIKVRTRISPLGTNFVIEEMTLRNGPLANERCAIGKGCCALTQTVPVLVTSA